MTLQDNYTSKLKKTRKHHVNTLNNIMVVFLRSVPRFHYITKRKNLEETMLNAFHTVTKTTFIIYRFLDYFLVTFNKPCH